MRHKKDRHSKLTHSKKDRRAQSTPLFHQYEHRSEQCKQDNVLHDPHPCDGHQAEQRAQPNQISVPVPRIGERLQGHGLFCAGGKPEPGSTIKFQILPQCLKILHVIGRGRHGGFERGLFRHGGGLKKHHRIGVIVHLEQLEAAIFRVQPLLLYRKGGLVHVPEHRFPGQRTGGEQQRKEYRQSSGKHCQQAQSLPEWVLLSCTVFFHAYLPVRLPKSSNSFLAIIP